jgi:LysM repeat protein
VALAGLLAVGSFEGAGLVHTVRRGETLSQIGRRYDVSVGALVRENGLADADLIVVGRRLQIPGTASAAPAAKARVHTVAAGETLSAIAGRYGVTVTELVAANRVRNADRILVGARLDIPGAGGEPGPAVPQRSLADIPSVSVPPLLTLTHTVRPGDSVGAIARAYGVSPATLVSANELANANLIRVGEQLIVPGIPGDVVRLPSFVVPTRRPLATAFAAAAVEFGVPVELAMAVGHMESGWQNGVVSSVGALGIMQVTPETVTFVSQVLLGRSSDLDPGDPVSNIRMGTRFLAYLLDQTGGDVDEALAGYNQGLLSVRQRGLYDETRMFVAGVVVLRDRFAEARRG